MGNGSAAAATGTIESTLAQIAALVETRPDLALTQAQALLARTGSLPQAELLACQALRRLDRPEDALPRLAALGRLYPRIPAIGWELAQAAEAAGDTAQAITALEALTRQQPSVAGGWFGCCARWAARRMPGAPTCRASTLRRAIAICWKPRSR